jgi:hypothetical protein
MPDGSISLTIDTEAGQVTYTNDKAAAMWTEMGFDAGQACRDNLAAVKAVVSP